MAISSDVAGHGNGEAKSLLSNKSVAREFRLFWLATIGKS